MRFGRCLIVVGLRWLADGTSQCPPRTGRVAELNGEIGELRRQTCPTPGLANRSPQHCGHGEMLKQCHDVGKGLVEGHHVTAGWLLVAWVQPVEQGMRGLVRYDVV